MKAGKADLFNKIFFCAVFVVVFIISCVFVPGIRTSGSRNVICADLLFALSIVTGIIYENRRAASVVALAFGIVSDIFLTPPIHLSPLLFFFAAYYSAKTVRVFTRENAVTAAISAIPFFLARSVVGCVYILSVNDGVKFGYVIKNVTLPELAFNVTSVFFTYFVINFVYKRIKRRFFI